MIRIPVASLCGGLLGFVVALLMHAISVAVANPSTLFESQCADCHYVSDFEGVTKPELESHLAGIVSGDKEHPPTDLTAENVAVMVEYLSNQ